MSPRSETRLAQSPEEIAAAQRLRYSVFVEELLGNGSMVDHAAKLEKDAFDEHAHHLLLFDHARENDEVVGVYRLLEADGATKAGRWYSANEYDLSPLLASGRRLLELGRSCLHADYRGGVAMMHLWQALAAHITAHKIDVLFGVASFHGTDLNALAAPLSLLHHKHLAPEGLRPRAIGSSARSMNLVPEPQIDRVAAMRATPALIKAYLRLGGTVGEGAWVDHDFNTTDVCLVMDTTTMSARHKAVYTEARI